MPKRDPPWFPLPLPAAGFLLDALDPVLALDPAPDARFFVTPSVEARGFDAAFFLAKLLYGFEPPFLFLYVLVAFVFALG